MRVVVLGMLVCIATGCGRESDTERRLGAARRVAEGEGAPALSRSIERFGTERMRFARAQSLALAGRYSLPTIEDRIRGLEVALADIARTNDDLRGVTVVALGSDGAVLASVGPTDFPRASRALVDVPSVRPALAGNVVGRSAASLEGGAADVVVASIVLDRAVVGALVIIESVDSIVARFAREVRSHGGPLERAGICVDLGGTLACDGVPDRMQAAARSALRGNPRVTTNGPSVVEDPRHSGVGIEIRMTDAGDSALLFVPTTR